MPSKIYKSVLINRINAFLKESESADTLTHLGLRGEIRESGLGKLIEDMLPVDWGIGNGKIIDSNDNQSNQTDLIIYYKKVFPPIFFSNDNRLGIFPLESCGFAFEVKTNSTSQEIETTIKKFNVLKGLKPALQWSESSSYELNIQPIRIYFALRTDLKHKTEIDRYKELDQAWDSDPAIQIICIVGKGVWIFNKNKKEYSDQKGYWVYYVSDKNHKELLILFSMVINQLISIVTYGSMDMRNYFLTWEEILKRE